MSRFTSCAGLNVHVQNSRCHVGELTRTAIAVSLVLLTAPALFAQGDDYGPPMPVVPNGGSLSHNGWTLSNAANTDNSNVAWDKGLQAWSFSNAGIVLKCTVSVKHSSGPSHVATFNKPGWAFRDDGHFVDTFGRGVSPPEYNWSVGGTVTIEQEIAYTYNLKGTYTTIDPVHGTNTTVYGLSGLGWLWAYGERVSFDITGEPEMW